MASVAPNCPVCLELAFDYVKCGNCQTFVCRKCLAMCDEKCPGCRYSDNVCWYIEITNIISNNVREALCSLSMPASEIDGHQQNCIQCLQKELSVWENGCIQLELECNNCKQQILSSQNMFDAGNDIVRLLNVEVEDGNTRCEKYGEELAQLENLYTETNQKIRILEMAKTKRKRNVSLRNSTNSTNVNNVNNVMESDTDSDSDYVE